MFYTMLAKFEGMSLTKGMELLADAVDDMNYLKMRDAAHGIKGSSGYIAASHLHYAGYFIQEKYEYD